MDNILKIVDFLHKYKANMLTAEERQELERWLANDENRRFFDRLMSEGYEKKVMDELAHYHAISAYEKFSATLKQHKRWNGRLFLRIAAVLVLPLAIAILLLARTTLEPLDSGENRMAQVVTTGSAKAVLTLENGKKMTLGQEQLGCIVNENGVTLVADSLALSYQKYAESDEAEIRYNEIYVPRKGEFSLRLSDGTCVYLNSDTKLRYPVAFGKGERRVILEGEAYFEVVRDSLCPFVVASGDMCVRVLGTTFNVKAYKEEQILTTLVSGRILVEQGEQTMNILPGEQVCCYREHAKLMCKSSVNTLLYTAWKDGFFKFERESLGNIMTILGRWYDVEIVFKDPEMKESLFSGDLKKYEDLQQHLKMLEITTNIQFVIKDKTVYVEYK